MKGFTVRLLIIILIIFVLYFFRDPVFNAVVSATTISNCDRQIYYSLGYLDPQFEKSETQILADLNTAAKIWNEHLGRDLLVYDPQGKLDINLSYDSRQRLLVKANQEKESIRQSEESLNIQIDEYHKRSAELEQKIDKLNEEIRYWNSRGGAPQDEYEKLIMEQSNLNSEINRLNEAARRLNQNSSNLNNQVNSVNKIVDELNSLISAIPEEGLYEPKNQKITIYFYDNKERFVHTLAHEFGHAIGIDHATETSSIMYPMTSETVSLSQNDVQLFEEACKMRLPKFIRNFDEVILNLYLLPDKIDKKELTKDTTILNKNADNQESNEKLTIR